jgi:hypothetical protein
MGEKPREDDLDLTPDSGKQEQSLPSWLQEGAMKAYEKPTDATEKTLVEQGKEVADKIGKSIAIHIDRAETGDGVKPKEVVKLWQDFNSETFGRLVESREGGSKRVEDVLKLAALLMRNSNNLRSVEGIDEALNALGLDWKVRK